MKEDKPSGVFWHSYLSAAVFYLISLYWLCNVKPMGSGAYGAWLALSLYLSIHIAAPLALAKLLQKRTNADMFLTVPALMTVFEFIREWLFSGFQLLTPAQSQNGFIGLLQLLKITGVYGPAFLVYFTNMLIASAAYEKNVELTGFSRLFAVFTSIALCVLAFAANLDAPRKAAPVKAAIIQPDIDQGGEWSQEYRLKALKLLEEMIRSIKTEKPDIIVWPETAYPGLFGSDPARPAMVAGWSPGSWNFVGSDRAETREGVNIYYNTAFLTDPQGKITGSYSKYHLVPFGEYVPLQDKLKFIRQAVRRYGYVGFTPGDRIEPLTMAGLKIGAIICYDGLFPEISREYARKGARILAHLSYETWYGNTPASAQIFQNTALRAVENSVPIIRSVASGMSGFVDARGRIYNVTGLFEKRAVVDEVYPAAEGAITIYTRFGDWFAYFCVLMTAAAVAAGRRNRR
ncbi:MAG TPA: apolipoprotein N-acyltransferase, partial [Candidatus Goldiibacteriota bacterium]|nr:apolipoprotein N-acyltransferase [Candidatus Goldiibacteriota bacterium]